MTLHPRPFLTLLSVSFICFLMPAARASVIINVSQLGRDVVAVGTGSLNLSSLQRQSDATSFTAITEFVDAANNEFVRLLVGGAAPPQRNALEYIVVSGPLRFGFNIAQPTTRVANDASGSVVGLGVVFGERRIYFSPSYVSGASIASSATWRNQTFESLGLTPGTYRWTWGVGSNADFLELDIAAPEPASFALLGFGVVAMATFRARRLGR